MADLQMMKCDRINLTLSTAGCARLYTKAQKRPPDAWSAHAACSFCPIGARHAGQTVAPMARVTAAIGGFCPRCQRPAQRFIAGHHCVSCYNRAREAARRVDGRGKVPRFADAAHTEVVCVAEGTVVEVRVARTVTSRVEAMLTMAKGARKPMAFGRAPLDFDAAMPLRAA